MAKQSANQPDKVTAFLVGLATDPAKLGRFIQSPDSELEAAGIDEADRAILKSGNAAVIHARIGGQPAPPRPDPMFMLVSMSDDGQGGTRPSVAQAIPPMIFATQHPVWPPMIFATQHPVWPPMIFAAHPATPMLFMMNASPSPMMAHAALAASPTLPLAPPGAHLQSMPQMMMSPSPFPQMMSPMMMSPSPFPPMPFPPMMMSPSPFQPMPFPPMMSPLMMMSSPFQPIMMMSSPFPQMMSPMTMSQVAPGGTG